MQLPKYSFKKKIGEPFEAPGKCKVTGSEGGLPNIDDGYLQGIPLGGLGAGTLSQNYSGDFSTWQLEPGKHEYQVEHSCQFGIYENGEAFILNGNKPSDGSLSKWNFKEVKGNYHALYPTAYFEYEDLDIVQEQYSPILPNNYQESSYPVAVFRWHISNKKNKEKERNLSLLWTFKSPFGSKNNFFYQENSFSGMVFDNLGEKDGKLGQLGIFSQNEDVEVSYINSFNEKGDGDEVWKHFSTKGRLIGQDDASSDEEEIKNKPAAICANITVNPGDEKVITFVLSWDFPIVDFNENSKWYKKYTYFYGKDGRNVTKIARKTYGDSEKWLLKIKNWQDEISRNEKPDWFKSMILNELYYTAAGGTIWTVGKVESEIASKVKRVEEHFGILECFDYPFYETLDVRFYGSFPLLKMWPDLEKIVLKDYIKTIPKEDLDTKFYDHPMYQKEEERKKKGAVPHDLGSPNEKPFQLVNSYPHMNVNKWKDLNSKFVLMIYRYYFLTGCEDKEFLEYSWSSVVEAIDYLKKFDVDSDCLLENENIPDQTYDNWSLEGPGVYCNGLWLAALKAVCKIGEVIGKDTSKYKTWFEEGQKSLEEKLYSNGIYLLDTQEKNKNVIMADMLCGQWYADILELGDIFNSERVNGCLQKIYNTNVLKVEGGKRGAINGISLDGEILPASEIWRENTQWNEIWTGTTLALSSHLYLRGFKEEALNTIHGVYSTIYEEKGYMFRTPEAWDVNGNFRASLYHRPGAMWAFTFGK